MRKFRDLLEGKTLYSWVNGLRNNYRVSSAFTMTNKSGVSLAATNLQWLVKKPDVTAETGNSGTKNYYEYMKKRFVMASATAKNNKEFAENLNYQFGTSRFTDEKLF